MKHLPNLPLTILYVLLSLIVILPVVQLFLPQPEFQIAIGGCFADTISYGWPWTFLVKITSCATCCTEDASYPVYSVVTSGLIMDFLYFSLGVFLVRKLWKKVKPQKKQQEHVKKTS